MANVKFPRIHIAESVTNRLLNLRDTLAYDASPTLPSIPEAPPSLVDPALEGGAVNMALAKPTGPADVGGNPAMEGIAGNLMRGGSLVDLVG